MIGDIEMKNKKLVIAITIVIVILACIGAAAGLYAAVEAGIIPNPHGAVMTLNV